jgi:hypothetical protein
VHIFRALTERQRFVIFLCALSLIAIAAYSRNLFSFFISDDFIILNWLRDAHSRPWELWDQFTGPWLGMQAIKYYRPISMCLWLIEYSLWKESYTAYIWIDLTLLLASGILVMLIAFELQEAYQLVSTNNQKPLWYFPLVSFGCFVLYPLHPETVVWMCNGFVLFETLFSLLSIWAYLRWLRQRETWAFCGALIALFLALLSKETAVATPFIVTVLAILTPTKRCTTSTKIISVAFFWLVFAAYALIRRLALGEFIGGWPANTVFYSHSPVKEFAFSIWKVIVPLSAANNLNKLIGPILWIALLAPAIFFSVKHLRTIEHRYRWAFSLSIWFLLAIIPPYRFFLIDRNLLHSVFAYPCTVPLSIVLGFCLASLPRFSPLALIVPSFFLLSSLEVSINSRPWAEAGAQVEQFIRQLRKVYENIEGDPPLKIIGLDWENNGAYVFLNALSGITRYPFLNRDIHNCSYLDGRDTLFPVGLAKTMMADGKAALLVYRWQMEDLRLSKINLSQAKPQSSHSCLIKLDKTENGDYPLAKGELDCLKTGILKVKISSPTEATPPISGVTLFFRNDAVPKYNQWDTCRSEPCLSNPKAGEFVFALRDLPDWTFGGACHSIKVLGARQQMWQTIEIAPMAEADLAPTLTTVIGKEPLIRFADILDISIGTPCTINFDAARIKDSTAVICEIRTPSPDNPFRLIPISVLTDKHTRGQLSFVPSKFGKSRIFVRLRAVRADGSMTGWWSDQICLGNKS